MPNSFEDQHFQEQADLSYKEQEIQQDYKYQQHAQEQYTAVVKYQAVCFANELVDLITRYNFSLLPTLGTAQDDLINALAKINLLKEQL